MRSLIAVLVDNGWGFTPPSESAPYEASRLPKNMPAEVIPFCRSFDVLATADETAWFLSHLDYAGRSNSAFAWNEFEVNDRDAAMNDAERASVTKFWGRYFPLAMCVRGHHRYLAIGVERANAGKIVLGDSSREEEASLLADDLGSLTRLLADFYSGNHASPVSRFLT